MGQNLILNAADHGFTVVAFNRTVSKVDRFLENEAKGRLLDLAGLSGSKPTTDHAAPRQIHRWGPLDSGVYSEAQDTSQDYALSNGWETSRRLY